MKNLSELDLTGGESVKNKGDQRLAYLLLGKFYCVDICMYLGVAQEMGHAFPCNLGMNLASIS